jgi:hypothetical protein
MASATMVKPSRSISARCAATRAGSMAAPSGAAQGARPDAGASSRRRGLDWRGVRPVPPRPHLLGVDDGPFEKFAAGAQAPLAGVVMEGRDRVEVIALTRFPVDGDGVTDFLGDWIEGLRVRPALQAICFGGITLAGLALLDPEALSLRLRVPVLVLNRRPPRDAPLRRALRAAGLEARIPALERLPAAFPLGALHACISGASREEAALFVERTRGKSRLPEALRVAHLVARAVATGESRGRP